MGDHDDVLLVRVPESEPPQLLPPFAPPRLLLSRPDFELEDDTTESERCREEERGWYAMELPGGRSGYWLPTTIVLLGAGGDEAALTIGWCPTFENQGLWPLRSVIGAVGLLLRTADAMPVGDGGTGGTLEEDARERACESVLEDVDGWLDSCRT